MLDLLYLLLGCMPSVWWCMLGGYVSVLLLSSWSHVILELCWLLDGGDVINTGCLFLESCYLFYLAVYCPRGSLLCLVVALVLL
jgi:hypothetical protein